MNTRFPRAAALALAAALPGLLGGCREQDAGASAAAAPADPPGSVDVNSESRALIGLAVTELQPQTFTVSITAPGTVRADQDKTAQVGPIIEGQISQVLASWGDTVARGQVLAWLDSVAVGEAKAAHFRAQAGLSVAESTLKRMETLATGKIVATKDLTAAQADLQTARAEADSAESALHVIGFTADDVAHFSQDHDTASRVPLVAPMGGTIVDRSAEVGVWAAPPATLFTIMDLGTLWVDAQVYEKHLGSLKPGEPVTVSVVAFPGRTFTGQVSYVGSTVDEATRTTVVRTVVANPDALLKPGMFATVNVVVRSSPGTLVVPEGAVLQQPGKSQVVVEQAGRYALRDVQVGTSSGGLFEITGGLTAGDRVVTSGQNQIAAELAGSAGEP